jgi:hypothetical protein
MNQMIHNELSFLLHLTVRLQLHCVFALPQLRSILVNNGVGTQAERTLCSLVQLRCCRANVISVQNAIGIRTFSACYQYTSRRDNDGDPRLGFHALVPDVAI